MNAVRRNLMGTAQAGGRILHAGDVLIIAGLIALLYAGLRLASPTPVAGPEINLSPSALPWYAFLSLMRMAASYVLSLGFALVYGYIAAHNRSAERVLLPILDVLQSVPLLSFLPVVLLVLTSLLPSGLGVEASAVVLIFTGQAWNIVYSFHQSVKTVPHELQEASANFRLNWWYRLRYMELPFSMLGLLWNSIVSWANGWFFLMAAETFRVGSRDFRLQGLGSYLQAAADAGDGRAIIFGFVTLVLMVVMLDQLMWQPLLAWAEKFRLDLVENDNPPVSWFYDLISGSRLVGWFNAHAATRFVEWLDRRLGGLQNAEMLKPRTILQMVRQILIGKLLPLLFLGWLVYLFWQAAQALLGLSLEAWGQIGLSTLASGGRVFAATVLGLLWTVPVGVWVGTNPKLSARIQPLIQSIAAIPATAFFAVIVAYMVTLPFGLDSAAILLMMLGTQWYLLFNIIAGASALPQELRDVSSMFRINGWARWRTLILPYLLPYIITGLNIAGGGAWNASIVAEYTQYKSHTYSVIGLGSLISQSTATGNYPMLLAATLTMIVTVVAVNYLLWQRLHRFVQQKYRLD